MTKRHPLSAIPDRPAFKPTKLREKPDPEVKAKAIARYWAGDPVADIARDLNIPKTMPHQWATENGAAPRPFKPRPPRAKKEPA